MPSEVISYQPATGRAHIALTSWAGDASFGVTPLATDQIEYPSGLTVGNDGAVTGSAGTYSLRLVKASTGQVYGASYVIAGEGAGTGSTTFALSPPANHAHVTLASGLDTYLFKGGVVPLSQGQTVHASTPASCGIFAVNSQYQGDWVDGQARVTVEPADMQTGQVASPWFVVTDGKFVFSGERTTPTNTYQFRSELRHQTEFQYADRHQMRMRCTIPNSTLLEYTFGQMHRKDVSNPPPPCRLAWEASRSGLTDHLWVVIRRDNGTYERTALMPRPDVEMDVQLIWDAGTLIVIIDDVVRFSQAQADWSSYADFYYKAGVYLTGSAAATGTASNTISLLTFGEPGWVPVPVPSWQLVYPTLNNTSISNLAELQTDAETAFDVWAVTPTGTWYGLQLNPGVAGALNPPAGVISFGSPTVTQTTIEQSFSYSATDHTGFEYKVGDGSWSAATSPISLSGLAASTGYAIYVRALNADGFGNTSATTVTTAEAPPADAPVIGTPVVGSTTATIPFTWPGVAVTGFEYRINSGSWGVTAAPVQLAGLQPETLYTIEVRAYNGLGQGPADSVQITTDAAPEQPVEEVSAAAIARPRIKFIGKAA